MAKVLSVENSKGIYSKLASKRAEKGDYVGALNMLYSALKAGENEGCKVYSEIARTYGEMGMFEQSNRFWFRFLKSAPKSRATEAYMELGINFFYMNDLYMSSYYLKKKVDIDGFLPQEEIDDELIDFLEHSEIGKKNFFLAYPFERSDYTYLTESGKKVFGMGEYEVAIDIFSKIPLEKRDEDVMGELSMAYYMMGKNEEAKECCKQLIKKYGDNITAYCNLSSICRTEDDIKKSEYYYNKALKIRKGDRGEDYKIATCAIEQKDHKTARDCLKRINDEREYDEVMQLFYGMALANLGEYEKASIVFDGAYMLDPESDVLKFYSEYGKKLKTTGKDQDEMLPFLYENDYPEKVRKSYEEIISGVIKKPNVGVKIKEIRKAVRWALLMGGVNWAKKALFLMQIMPDLYSEKLMTELLMSGRIAEEIKRFAIYMLITQGYKGQISVVENNIYFTRKHRNLVFGKNLKDYVFLSAYAFAVANTAKWNYEDMTSELALCINKLYTYDKELIENEELSGQDIASIVMYLCRSGSMTLKETCDFFGSEKEKVKGVIKILEGEERWK